MTKFNIGDRVVCKGKMDCRNIDGQLASIHYVYAQNPPRFCELKFDRDFDKGGIYWDVFYEQLQLVNSKFWLQDVVIANDGKESIVTGVTNEGIYLDSNKWYCPNEEANLIGRKVLL